MESVITFARILHETPIKTQRLGFLAGEIAVPDDFNTMGQTEIGGLFGENPG